MSVAAQVMFTARSSHIPLLNWRIKAMVNLSLRRTWRRSEKIQSSERSSPTGLLMHDFTILVRRDIGALLDYIATNMKNELNSERIAVSGGSCE